jgi:1-deoxy-D-xylulose-5-phosphate synthase
MIKKSLEIGGPVAIRYPRGSVQPAPAGEWPEIEWGTWEQIGGDPLDHSDVVILALGKTLEYAMNAVQDTHGVSVVNARFIKPLDETMLERIGRSARAIITVEDNTVRGGFGSAVLEFLASRDLKPDVRVLGIPDEFMEHAEVPSLHRKAGIDVAGIKAVLESLGVKAGARLVGGD